MANGVYGTNIWAFNKNKSILFTPTNASNSIPSHTAQLANTPKVAQGLSQGAQNLASNFGSIASGAAGIANAAISGWQLYENIKQNKELNKQAKENLALAKAQYEDEKNRYERREQERQNANEQVASSASLFNPMSRM